MATRKLLMRKAEPFDRPFHLLEELSSPFASLTARRIVLWVYCDGGIIREVVLSGHAERRTCSAATTAITQALKRIDDDAVHWFMTCGAAHIRVNRPTETNQSTLRDMVGDFRRLEKERGLISVKEDSWHALQNHRQRRSLAAASSDPLITLPDPSSEDARADFLPIYPQKRRGSPLVFHLEGWDFDDPLYQSVADIHLHSLMRETLSDAIRRRLIYRGWLRAWTVDGGEFEPTWPDMLHAVRKEDADTIRISVPLPETGKASSGTKTKSIDVGVETFLREHLPHFLGSDESLGVAVAQRYALNGFGRMAPEVLHERTKPARVAEYNFERGVLLEREARDEDAASHFDQLVHVRPLMVSECLRYIDRMDWHIRPYEALRRGVHAPDLDEERARDYRFHDQLNRRIVLETMIRGWPSFYLERKADREVFQRWADSRRETIWGKLVQQAREAGVSPQVLLEENVVFDVRFDEDLGCTIQPLMLTDSCSHAEVHGSRAKASISIPLWTRRRTRPLRTASIASSVPATRVAALVERARELSRGSAAGLVEAEALLREALATHPGRASRLIFDEWRERLTKDPFSRFRRARILLEAVRLAQNFRFAEAIKAVDVFLQEEPRPPPDAIALAGICAASLDATHLKQLRDNASKIQSLRVRYNEICERMKAIHESLPAFGEALAFGESAAQQYGLLVERQRQSVDEFQRLDYERREIEGKLRSYKAMEEAAAKSAKDRVVRIENALLDPAASRKAFPALARAAERAPQILRAALDCPDQDSPLRGLYGQGSSCSKEFIGQYGQRYGRLVKLLGLLGVVEQISRVSQAIEEDGPAARRDHIARMRHLSEHLWLAPDIAEEIRTVAEEFDKGDWDQMQAKGIEAFLEDLVRRCSEQMNGLGSVIGERQPSLVASLAQLHLLLVIFNNYQEVFDRLAMTRISVEELAGADIECLGDDGDSPPADCMLAWNQDTSEVDCVGSNGRRTLLRFRGLGKEVAAHLRKELGELPVASFFRPGMSLAVQVLAVPVRPLPDWDRWMELMQRLKPEMLVVLSEFSRYACFLPDYVEPFTPEQEQKNDQLLGVEARDTPEVDWNWTDLDEWRSLIPAGVRRQVGYEPRDRPTGSAMGVAVKAVDYAAGADKTVQSTASGPG